MISLIKLTTLLGISGLSVTPIVVGVNVSENYYKSVDEKKIFNNYVCTINNNNNNVFRQSFSRKISDTSCQSSYSRDFLVFPFNNYYLNCNSSSINNNFNN